METPLATQPLETAARPEALPLLRPLSMGEILDRALGMFRSNFLRLLAMMLVFQAPAFALRKLFERVLQAKAPALVRPASFAGSEPPWDQFLWMMGATTGLVLVTLLFFQLAIAAHASAASRAHLGNQLDPVAALKDAFSRAPQVLGTSILLLLWSQVVLALAAVPGVVLFGLGFVFESPALRVGFALGGLGVAGLAVLVVSLYLLLRYALVSEVVMIERLSFRAALQRSARLMAGSVGPGPFGNCKLRASILYAVNLCVSISVAVVTSLPTAALWAAYGISPLKPDTFDPSVIPLWLLLPAEILQVFAEAALAPFGLLAMVVFYFDVRVRREGLDLELKAARLGGER